ncbi:MAG: alpha-mannosidase, partial [Ignavibacteriales bacterium]|nr:alpha-mannosidase [Ignavibacteriales bacterium]
MAIDLLNQILPFVKEHIYLSRIPLQDWKLKEGEIGNASSPKLKDASWKNYTIPAPWGGFDKTVWFRKQISIPENFAGKQVALTLELSEALVYINGKPHHGVDQNHQEILLTTKARAHQLFTIAIQAYSGRSRELNSFNSAHLAVLNPTARALYHGLNALHEVEKISGHNTNESKEMRELIRQTLIFLKYFKPDGEEYPNAIGRAYEFLIKTLEAEYKTDIQGLIHLVAQSHIDVVWLWTLKEVKRKCGRTFSTALRLMEEFPEFTFAQSQAQLYEYTKENYPELYKEIKQRVIEGRWHPIGSTWVEPDCNIPNGESLIRQIFYGKRFFKSEFNVESDTLWLPDTFGYSWALPQILKKSGIKYFFTTKLTWNDANKFPHNTFWWQGVDGTKILTHIPPIGLEGSVTPKDLRKSWESLEAKEEFPHTVQTFGFGDGGGGPTKEQIETSKIYRTIIGLPPSTLSSVSAFFKQAEEQGKVLPLWTDELYLEKHRGTYTTHGWIKKENRQAEILLYNAELLATLSMLFGKGSFAGKYPQQKLEGAWKKLLLNQFHDILPGSAIEEAYEDARRDFSEVRSTCNALIEQASSAFMQKEKKNAKGFHFSVFNALSWRRSEYVTLTVKSDERNFVVADNSGKVLEYQIGDRKKGLVSILCYIENIPPFSFVPIVVTPSAEKPAPSAPWKLSNRVIETPLFKLRLDSKGQFSSIYDKSLRRELVAKGGRANQLQTFKDTPKQWDAWDIEPDYRNKELDLFKFKSAKIVEQGPLRAVIRMQFQSENKSTITQDVLLYHKLQRIDFSISVNWREKHVLLKAAFPFNVKTNAATYEIQFGALKRTTKPTDSWQKAKFEVPAQQWADVSEAKFGVSLLNDSKYGYDASQSTLRLTLIRSPFYPHPTEP